MKRTLLKLVLSMAGIAGLTSALAASPVYQVEMIVFSHLTTGSVNQEQWPRISPPPSSFPNSVSLDNENAANYYEQLPATELVMQREQSELNRNGGYQTLLHAAWRQPMTGGSSQTVHLVGGRSYEADGQTQWSVNGTARVTLDRYFNVNMNLFFAVPEKNLARFDTNDYFHNNNNLMYFHLADTRRMKSKELNYIDYPLFGVLIKIVPIKSST